VVTISQEGQTPSITKEITLHFVGTLSTENYIGKTIYASIYDGSKAEFSQEAGIIKNVTSSTVVIDISGMSQTQIDIFYNDFVSGDQIEESNVYFGLSSDEDPTVSWQPFLKTTETGIYDYATEYVANIWKQAYTGNSKTIECEILNEPQHIVVQASFELANIIVPYEVFSDASLSEVIFNTKLTTTSGQTFMVDKGLTLTAPSVVTPSVEGVLWCSIDDWDLPKEDSLAKIEIFARRRTSDNFPILEGTTSDGPTFQFTNTQKPGQSYSSVFNDGRKQTLGFTFPETNRIPLVGTMNNAVNTLSMSSTRPTITIDNIS
jgi:hypothetical protein